MQMHYLHKNFYKLYAYSRTQETLEKYQNFYQDSVSLWEKLKNEDVCPKTCQEVTGISALPTTVENVSLTVSCVA